jgi:hypothetical protein
VVIITAEEEGEEASVVVAMSPVAAAGPDQLEAAAVSVAVASAQRPRRSVARAHPLVWDRAEAELASACRIIGGLSTLMDELPGPYLHPLPQEQRLISRGIVLARHAMLLGNGRRQRLIVQPTLQRRVHLKQVYTGD